IILSVITLIMVLLLIFLCNRIRIAIALIKEGSRAVSTMMFTLIWPVIPFFLEVIIFVVWAIMAVYLATSGQPVYMVGEVPNNYNGSAFTNGTECDPEVSSNLFS
uniref:Choline transporter-like protein n=1 Tax=Saccoglossus kowalevskii TaxID=10224 RepID=A0ABM0LX66_SACKO